MGAWVGVEVNGVVAGIRPVAPVVLIVFEVVVVAVLAASVMAKIQVCSAALVEWVEFLALRYADDLDLSRRLVFGSSMDRVCRALFRIRLGRVAGVCQTEAACVTVGERASDGQANGDGEVGKNGVEAHGDVGNGQ